MVDAYQLFIDGQWANSSDGNTFPALNPFNQEVWASIPQATDADVRAAIAAARRAYENTWRHTNGLERATLLHRLAGLIKENVNRMSLLETTDTTRSWAARRTGAAGIHGQQERDDRLLRRDARPVRGKGMNRLSLT